jgi:hypothetical protein
MLKDDPRFRQTVRRLAAAFLACHVALFGAAFAGASDELLLGLGTAAAGGFTLFVVLRMLPMSVDADPDPADVGSEGSAAQQQGPATPRPARVTNA